MVPRDEEAESVNGKEELICLSGSLYPPLQGTEIEITQ